MGASKVSKSKTFDVQTEWYELCKFLEDNIETEEIEAPYHLGLDIKVETVHKYKVTVTKIENDRT
jgi:hypothetical protein